MNFYLCDIMDGQTSVPHNWRRRVYVDSPELGGIYGVSIYQKVTRYTGGFIRRSKLSKLKIRRVL